MNILAIDLGTTTGWALSQGDGSITSGSLSFRPARFEGGGMRYLRFKRWLNELLTATGKIDAVYVEEVRRHAGVDAAHAYGGFLAHLTAWCEHHSISYAAVPLGTIKRHATGKGNAGKPEMIAAARARGFTPTDDNEADALALLILAVEQLRGCDPGPLAGDRVPVGINLPAGAHDTPAGDSAKSTIVINRR